MKRFFFFAVCVLSALSILSCTPEERAELIESLNGKSGSVASGPIVTVGADYVSAISAVLKGEMNLGAKMSPDLVFGIMWSEYSGVLPMNSKKVPAEQIDAKPGSPNSYCYQIVLAGLKPDKTYYFRSYLTQNSEDTYGETKSFTTKKQSSLVETLDATEIIITHAVLNGRIDYASLSQAYENIEYGFYWGVSANRQEEWGCFGGGELQGDTYSAMLNELSSGGQYYYKAYLKLGENVYDGDVKTFTTNRYVNGIMLNKYSLSLIEGDAETIIATITPEDAYDKTYTWSSSNESVVQVDQNGTITAVSEGEAYVRVVANDGGGKSASCYVTVFPEMVDLGLSVKWRSYNMGASKPEEYGDYYAWGETEPKDSYSWSTYQYGTNSSQSKYNDTDNLLYLDGDDDVAQVKLGGSWRMPTEEEFVELKDNCTWTWTTLNNVCGCKVTSKKSGSQSKWIFLPATAYDNETGEYWSSSLYSIYSSSYASCLLFGKNNARRSIDSRCMGLAIRPVSSSQDITSVELKNVMNLPVSESETLIANILPTNAINRTLLWSSDNTSVATVDQNGKVIAVAAGIATITAKSSNGRSASCTVFVKDWVSSISFDKSELVIYNGTSEKITATVLPSSSIQSLEWSSDNTSVAEVSSSGVVTGISKGTATITATAKDGSGVSQTCRVEVKQYVTDITLDKTTLVLNEGQTETMTANVAPDDAYDKSLTWSSSNASVATVDQNGKVTAVSKGTATITVTAKDGSGKKATCPVFVPTDLSSSASANSYIVSSAGTYSFKTVKGNSSTSVGSVSKAEVLWESFGTSTTPSKGAVISNVSYSDNYIAFATPSTLKNGNAVIAAKDESGNILWSWHIWVCSGYNPASTAQTYYNSAGAMMDRNLGATSATPGDVGALGLLYQWGRKDPFPGSSSISSNSKAASTPSWSLTVASNSISGTIAYAVAHPTTFITYNSSNFDWYYTGSSSTDNTRWQTSKTIYDPCPPGWKVPSGGSSGVWSKAGGSSSYFSYLWDSTNKGINFSGKFGSASTIWYPAAGCLYGSSGSLLNVGPYGSWWSCTPSDYYAYYLRLDSDGDVGPSGFSTRAYGLSVRCLQE